MNPRDLQVRTKRFAVDVINFTEQLPRKRANDVLVRQLISSASSIGANYREACRAESKPDFIHKVAVAAKEAAETEYWLDLVSDTNEGHGCPALKKEADELLRILISSGRTARAKRLQSEKRKSDDEQ
jgi:four helix bundle protein